MMKSLWAKYVASTLIITQQEHKLQPLTKQEILICQNIIYSWFNFMSSLGSKMLVVTSNSLDASFIWYFLDKKREKFNALDFCMVKKEKPGT